MSDKEKKPRKSPEKKAAVSLEEPKKAKKEKKDKPEKAAKLGVLKEEAAPKKKKKKDAALPEPIGEIAASSSAPEVAETSTVPPTHAEISARAFHYFLERGHRHGHHEEDWLRAERELWSKQ